MSPLTLLDPGWSMLAYRPFIDPLDLHDAWFVLLLPLAFFVAIAYKAVRVEDMARFWPAALWMAAQIVVGMIALGAAFFVVIEWLVPILAPTPM